MDALGTDKRISEIMQLAGIPCSRYPNCDRRAALASTVSEPVMAMGDCQLHVQILIIFRGMAWCSDVMPRDFAGTERRGASVRSTCSLPNNGRCSLSHAAVPDRNIYYPPTT